jgi:hypothetical protein
VFRHACKLGLEGNIARDPALSRSPVDCLDGAVHRSGAGSVQGFLEGLGRVTLGVATGTVQRIAKGPRCLCRGLITNGSHANMSARLGGGVMTFKSKIRIWKKLKAEHGHRVLVGSYAYTDADQTVEVRSLSGQRRATQLGGSTPETLARLMLIELADEEKA